MSSNRSEDAYGEKVDRCLYNALSKFVVGIGVGIVAAVVVRYKPWPIILGAGIGTGMGISDCNYEFKSGSLSKVVKQSLELPSKS
ncbi:hypothetical protein RRG08_023588 [Elysia crispata]|uniref:MICOS complex subunit MIC10 n=1 Tax=Elysia crispata TaxID=231223 RepID=A0AAE1EBX0_9GAST|nr:hypothetical protein RRG08_023588 [Elysia crispata]